MKLAAAGTMLVVASALCSGIEISSGSPSPLTAGCAGGALGAAHDVPGALCEDFDRDRNGSGSIEWTRLQPGPHPCDPLRGLTDPNDDLLGHAVGGGSIPLGVDGRICSTDAPYAPAQVTCHVVPTENDWHLHTTQEGCDGTYDSRPAFATRCAPDERAHSGLRSLHMGRHLSATDTISDTYRFRQTSAFVMDPVLLGPGAALVFWHIIDVCDDTCVGFDPGTTDAGGQVQVSLLDSVTGTFERWQRLTPAENGYNSVDQQSFTLCEFDPGDDQNTPLDETMCGGEPQWSDLGDVLGTDRTCTTDTNGDDSVNKDCGETTNRTVVAGCSWVDDPNCGSFLENGSRGTGVWARSQLDLSPFAGRVARLRWIFQGGGGWAFGETRSFQEPQTASLPDPAFFDDDDGWYVDDIRMTGIETLDGICVDPDGDGYGLPGDPTCPGGVLPDCDCLNAARRPGAPELCDGLDNDCDNIVPAVESDGDADGVRICGGDCNDANASLIAVPAAVEGLDVSDLANGYRFTWANQAPTAGTGTVYDVFTGSLSDLLPSGDFSTGGCFDENLSAPLLDFTRRDPPAGDAFYFMFRGQNACPGGTGTYGTADRDTTAAAANHQCH